MNDMTRVERQVDTNKIKLECRDCQVHYGATHAIKDVNVDIEDKTVTAFIGPSGCGKSTFLRCLNRMNDTIDIARVKGSFKNKADLDDIVEKSLRRGAIWDEVKDRLDAPGTGLSGGQQQRLCIARAVATEPEVLLMDEPCSALDPIATAQVEELIDELREQYSVVIVTHSMQQAARVSQKTAFFHLGSLVEFGETGQIFTNPVDPRTESYITGRIG